MKENEIYDALDLSKKKDGLGYVVSFPFDVQCYWRVRGYEGTRLTLITYRDFGREDVLGNGLF